jgi:hypothetical protein
VFDNPTEIVYLVHLLIQQNLDEDAIRQVASELFLPDQNKLSPEGLRFLQSANGHVSYVKGFNPLTFPRRVDAGRPIANFLRSLSVYRCWMSDHQVRGYVEALEQDRKNDNTWGLKQQAQYASLLVYPDGSYGSVGFKKYNAAGGGGGFGFLRETTLATYSCKLAELLRFIRDSPGPVFVHSVYVNENGIDVIAKMLLANGFQRDEFAIIKGDTSQDRAEQLRARFSSTANADGSLIKVLLGSQAVGEGMNLRNVRRVFIMEPHFNVSRIEQAIGRAIRHCSHIDLPRRQRKVEVFRMVASVRRGNRGPMVELVERYQDAEHPIEEQMKDRTVDELMYKIAEDKLEKSEAIEKVLQDNALDHRLNTIDDEDDDVPLDESTYDFARDVLRLAQVKAFLKGLFRSSTVWSLPDLIKRTIQEFGDDELLNDQLSDMVKWALDIIVTDKETVRNRYDRLGYVIYRGRFYVFNLFGMPENTAVSQRNLPPPVFVSKADINAFLDNDPRFQRRQKRQLQQRRPTPNPKKTQAELDRIRKRLEQENIPRRDRVVGCYKYDVSGRRQFAILLPSKDTGVFQTTGTVCAKASKIFKVHDLIDLALRLGVGTVDQVDVPIRFGYRIQQSKNKNKKWSLVKIKGQSRYDGKPPKEYICDLIRQKLEATDRMLDQCPTQRKRIPS